MFSKPFNLIFLLLVLIIFFSLLLPDGLRAAIANNTWSVRFIKAAYAQESFEPQSFSRPSDTHRHAGMLLAHRALKQDEVDLALSLLTHPNTPSDHLGFNALAQIHFLKGDYAEALQIWKNIKDAGSLNYAGVVLAEKDEIDLAIRAYQYAVEVRPEDKVYRDRMVGHMLIKANDLLKSDQLIEALEAYRAVLTQFPGEVRAYDGLARVYWQMDQQETALQVLQAGWDLGSDDFRFYLTAAGIYESAGMTENALSAYRRAAVINPDLEEAQQGIQRLSGTDD